ncbi:integrase [Billgrantia kenyensis]|uniref:Integrase n=1 Tax=Billgrantia kenyensis TaxID=321266 RepID=A0A7W0AFX4_9GAMM|nr:integrase [Halomonas kenyensis]MBA2781150.1 integrase [Halomonas kenyensis]MCG6663840.1 integrase [Halomonas kenyensis]
MLTPAGFMVEMWDETDWVVKSGRLVNESSKKNTQATLSFRFSKNLGGNPLPEMWGDIAKALVLIRYHRSNQTMSNQRQFVKAFSYIAQVAISSGITPERVNHEVLDSACMMISKHYQVSTAYNMHKAVAEVASNFDANGLAVTVFDYKYSRMRRPETSGGTSGLRLDDPKANDYISDKLIPMDVMRCIGELYLSVPKNHKYRQYVLMLSLFAILGRRFSEISLIPLQDVSQDREGFSFLYYFPRKTSKGNKVSPKERVYLPSDAVELVKDIVSEAQDVSRAPRDTAIAMRLNKGPDLNFLHDYMHKDRIYKEDLSELGLNSQLLSGNAWLKKNGLSYADHEKLNSQGKKPPHPIRYTKVEHLIDYLKKDFSASLLEPLFIDDSRKKYYLQDLMFVRFQGLSSGAYASWLSTYITHAMFSRFIGSYLSELVSQFCQHELKSKLTSHQFRHTINTLVDEGGMSDALQTEWFGRKNLADTKAYQHTTREQKILAIMDLAKEGNIGGVISKELKKVPVERQDAFLKARIKGVHDVGVGICVHSFSQNSCERHLQCSAQCRDFVWVKDDTDRVDEVKRQYAMTIVAQETALQAEKSGKGRYSSDWVKHNNKKIVTLKEELGDMGVAEFDPVQYLKGVSS